MVKGVEVGLPSACFLPIGKYVMQETGEPSSVLVPIRGQYEGGLEWDICPEPGVVLFGELTKVLYNINKYPRLMQNERLIIMGIFVNDDDGVVEVVGRIVKFLGKEANVQEDTETEAEGS